MTVHSMLPQNESHTQKYSSTYHQLNPSPQPRTMSLSCDSEHLISLVTYNGRKAKKRTLSLPVLLEHPMMAQITIFLTII